MSRGDPNEDREQKRRADLLPCPSHEPLPPDSHPDPGDAARAEVVVAAALAIGPLCGVASGAGGRDASYSGWMMRAAAA